MSPPRTLSNERDSQPDFTFAVTHGAAVLLQAVNAYAVWTVDLDGGVPEWSFDSTTVPELATLFHARGFMVDQSLPDGGGYVVEFVPWRVWNPSFHTPNNVYDTDVIYIMRDIDLDGTIDESIVTTIGELANVREYYVNELMTFP